MSDVTTAGRESMAATDRLLDDIDALVEDSLARPYAERSGYDNNVHQGRCGHCENDWHGLPQGRCPGSAVEGPMLPPPTVAGGGWAAPAGTTWDVAVNGRSRGLMQQIPSTWQGQTVRWAVRDEMAAFQRHDPLPVTVVDNMCTVDLPLADVRAGATGPHRTYRLGEMLAWFESMDPSAQVAVRSDQGTRRMRARQGADWVSMALGRLPISVVEYDPVYGLLWVHRRRRGHRTVVEKWTTDYAEHVGWTVVDSNATALHPLELHRQEFPSHHYRLRAFAPCQLPPVDTPTETDDTIHDARSYR